MSAIDDLKQDTQANVLWNAKDKPVLVADGRLYRINNLNSHVEAQFAYGVGVNQKSFQHLCKFIRVESLHF